MMRHICIKRNNLLAQMKLKMDNHIADPIGTFIGGNPATGGTLPEDKSLFMAMVDAVFGVDTAHNCYGKVTKAACERLWSNKINHLSD